MIKVAIYSGYGMPAMTNDMKKLIEDNKGLSLVELRMKLAEHIESRVGCMSELLSEDMKAMETWFKCQPEMFLRVDEKSENHTLYACWDCEEKRIKTISVVNVDETRRWGISEYDGAESVKYFKEPKVIDAKYNYCEWR